MIVYLFVFGLKLKLVDDSVVKVMFGIWDVFVINIYKEDYEKGFFDISVFIELVVVVGEFIW